MQITITCELNARNLEILKQLCNDQPIGLITPAVNTASHPVENPFTTISSTEIAGAGLKQEKLADEPQETAPAEEAPKISAQDVKAVCLKMSKAGRQSELKAAFAKFGGKKLSDISEADYPALMKELGDA